MLATICAAQERAPLTALDLNANLALPGLIGRLATRRVVFIGEIHDRYDHHLNQLEIIQALYRRNPDLAIGVEYLEQRFQPQVDDYIAGRSTESAFLRSTQYFQEWGYDYRLYAPIFRYAREQRIPVRALNVPSSLASAVDKVGLAGLSPQQRASLPRDIEPADEGYKARLRDAFEGHPAKAPGAFDHFVEAQLVWDESMAANAAEYLNAHHDRNMVILCGAGHVEFGSGIPSRLERRTHATYAIVLSSGEEIDPHIADYLVWSKIQNLPPAGVLGATPEEKNGECRIRSLTPSGAAQKAGLRRGDVVVAIDGQAIQTVADVRLALWDKKPGDRVRINVRRRTFLGERPASFEVELAAPAARSFRMVSMSAQI